MATLQNIRNRGGLLVSIVIGLALVAFIVGDALSSGASIFNRSRNQVGEIAGEAISITDFQNQVDKNEEIVKMMNGVSALNDEQQSMLRENTWQQMVMEQIMNQEYEELGIDVSSEELYDMLLGSNMSPTIRQMFADPNTGMVDVNRAHEIIRQLIAAPANTPQKKYWLNMEEQIATSRKQEKYNELMSKALYITDEQAQETAQNNAVKSDISYIVKNYNSIDDSTVSVSENEIKEYYNSHSKLFEQPESRKIVYVNFDIEASPEDYQETEKWVADMMDEFAETKNPGEFIELSSSDKKFDASYLKKEEISNDSLADFLFSGNKGVFGPYLEKNSYRISRTSDLRMLPDSVRARHILIVPKNNDLQQAETLADSLVNLLKKGADFEVLARQYSADQNSAVNGGDLGWFGQRMMVQPFSDTVFFAKPKTTKVVKTQYGIHIVQVTGQSKPVQKVQIATIEKEVIPSQKTTNKIYNEARTFSHHIKTSADFDKKVSETGLTKRIATVNKNDKTIAGMDNARELIRRTYLTDKTGEVIVSNEELNIFETGNKYTIAVLTEINEEGIAPLTSVKSQIKSILTQKKKGERLKQELEKSISGSGSLLSVAQKAGLDVKEATEITFNSFQLPGAGIEPKVIATATQLEEGKLSAPIAGNQGVYVIMVNSRTQDEVTPEQIAQMKNALLQSNLYRANYQAIEALIKNAAIKDTRYKFY